MSDGAAFLLILVGVLSVWAASLALFWKLFRTWALLLEEMDRCHPEILQQIGWPDRNPMDDLDESGPGAQPIPRGRVAALKARVAFFGLPGEQHCPENARNLARRYRFLVFATAVLLAAAVLVCIALEPALAWAAQAFFVGAAAWVLWQVVLIFHWRLWPGQSTGEGAV